MPLPIAAIYLAQQGRCFHCTKPMLMSACVRSASGNHNNGWTREHVTPRSKGGRRGYKNVVLAHAKCNHRRGNADPTPDMVERHARIRLIADELIASTNVKKVANDPALREAHYVHYRQYDPGPGEPKFNPAEWLRSNRA